MTPQEYGAKTHQHTQSTQQSALFYSAETGWSLAEQTRRAALCNCGEPSEGWPGNDGGELCQMCWEKECSDSWWDAMEPLSPTAIDVHFGCVHPATEDWLREVIEATFAHADRIDIETWSFPAEDAPLCRDEDYWREIAADTASDEDRL